MSIELFNDGINYAPSQVAYWAGQSILSGATVGAAPADDQVQRSQCQLVLEKTTPSGVVDDVAVFSFSFAKPTLSFGSSVISGTEKATVEGYLDTMFASLKTSISAHWTLREYRWHDYTDNWEKPGPATRVTAKGTVCTGAAVNVVPDQVASSVTFKTSSRIHWGRIYLPPSIYNSYDSTGRLTTATCDAYLAAVRTMMVAADAADCSPVVASTSHRALLGILSLQMDNTPDVIRSRRVKHTNYRKIYTS